MSMCLVVVLTPGCSTDEGSDGDALPAKPVAFGDYCDSYAQMGCAAAERCDCLGEVAMGLCESYLRDECHDDVEAPVEAGLMAYDEADAGRCLSAIAVIVGDCSLDGDDYPEACDTMLSGQVAEGGSCDDDDECLLLLECVGGSCVHLPASGEPCSGDGICAEDHSCADDGQCHAYAPFGGACTGGVICDDDLHCDPQTDTCAPYLSAGESCAHASWVCGDDLYCSPASDSCTPYPGPGGSCVDSSGTCVDDAYCGTDGSCHTQQAAGSACSDDEQCRSYDCVQGACTADEEDSCPFL